MTEPELTDREERMRDRQDGDYEPPILVEPSGGPIPVWAPEPDDEQS